MPWEHIEVKEQTLPKRNAVTWSVLLLAILSFGCTGDSGEQAPNGDSAPNETCYGFFGAPNAQSGLDQNDCGQSCQCGDGKTDWAPIQLESEILSYMHSNPPNTLDIDPYESELSASVESTVCMIAVDKVLGTYRLETVSRGSVALDLVTHEGPCGACSSLQDLRVYAENIDLTDPVRQCGILGISQGMTANIDCLKEIGFSEPCAAIWFYNTQNTRSACLALCLEHLNSPYVSSDGTLNPCLQCDEDESGPIFKAYSGRTRRNSGLPSSICRPCNSVSRIPHSYLTP